MENNNIEKTTDHKVVSSTSRHERDSNSRTDYTGSCKSTYHTVTTTTAPGRNRQNWYYSDFCL